MRVGLLLSCVLLAACGSKVSVDRTYEEREDLGEATYGSSVQFQSEDERALDQAKASIRDQKHAEATAALKRLYDDVSTKREIREEALYLLAEVQSALLNPDRDVSKAIVTYERFLEEFPRSELAFRAEESLERLRAQQEGSGETPE